MKIKIFLTALLLTVSLSNSFACKSIKWLDGSWEGLKYQTNANKAWQVKLSCDSKSATFTIEYPELNCKGILILKSIKGTTAIFTEKISRGECMDGGYIIITKASKDHITFTCLRENQKRLASYCTLERK